MNYKEYIHSIQNKWSIPKDHINYLKRLKNEGFEPNIIYDIGSCVLHWAKEAEKIWPDAQFIYFEANTDLDFVYENLPHRYFLEVLSDKNDSVVKYYKNKTWLGGNSYYKENNDNVFNEDHFEMRTTKTLDSIVKENNLPLPDLIKIDVQGAEIDILRGGLDTILHSKRLIVELQSEDYNRGALKVNQSLPIITEMGFKCVDPLFCNNGPDGDYGFLNERFVNL